MKRTLMLAGAVVALGACAQQLGSAPYRPPPGLSRADAEQLMLRAYEVRRSAFELPATAALSGAFGGAALTRLQRQAEGSRLRGVRTEERDFTRTLVYWNSTSLEGILQIAAESRVIGPYQPNQRWTGTLRQWWVRLEDVGGTWFVVDQEDLPPDRWRT